MSKIVIALGGNALGNTPTEQAGIIQQTAKPIVDLIEAGHQLIINHGNGPQVGMIQLGLATAALSGAIAEEMPFPECGAMSQGYIGYQLQKAIRNELVIRKMPQEVVSMVTQVVVDANDPAFSNPTKPIGAFYSEEQAKALTEEKGYVMKEDSGRGWRRVVPSPKPVDVVEKSAIRALYDSGYVVIAAGGGGVPVVLQNDGSLTDKAAVIDKDFAAAKLAELVNANKLVILTAVERVAINFNKPNQEQLASMTVAEAEKYCAEGQFAPGSMLPKVQAAMSFAKTGGTAVIAALENAAAAIKGESGTVITL